MSEYIIDMGNSSYQSISGLLCADVSQLREEIVRCRDCKHHENHGYWFMCQLPDCDGGYANWMVEPDGFCKWGEKRTKLDDARDIQ